MPNCTQGNKPCGKRCIPETYNCGSDPAQMETPTTENMQTRGEKRMGKGIRRKDNFVTRKSAMDKLEQTRQEAFKLAGGEEEYKQQLEAMIDDTGAGIKAKIVRSTMKGLAPNLVEADDLALFITTKKRGKYEEQVVNPDRRFKMSDMVRKGDKLKKGDIIRVRFMSDELAGGFGYHYGVYTGHGKLIQFGNDYLDPESGKRVKSKAIVTAETRLRYLNRKGRTKWEKVPGGSTKFSPEELDQRIAKVKGKINKYHMLHNNCEHFAYLLAHGKAYSSQTDVANRGVVTGVVSTLFRYLEHQRKRRSGAKGSFEELAQYAFSEKPRRKKNKKERSSKLDPDFRMPDSLAAVHSDLQKAQKFAKKASEGDIRLEAGTLGAWLKEYVENITSAFI